MSWNNFSLSSLSEYDGGDELSPTWMQNQNQTCWNWPSSFTFVQVPNMGGGVVPYALEIKYTTTPYVMISCPVSFVPLWIDSVPPMTPMTPPTTDSHWSNASVGFTPTTSSSSDQEVIIVPFETIYERGVEGSWAEQLQEVSNSGGYGDKSIEPVVEEECFIRNEDERKTIRPLTQGSQTRFGRSSTKNYCQLCRSNRETVEFYMGHQLRDDDGKVSCPVLRKLVCPTCSATGDAAHTRKYCPLVMVSDVPLQLRSRNFYNARAATAKAMGLKTTVVLTEGNGDEGISLEEYSADAEGLNAMVNNAMDETAQCSSGTNSETSTKHRLKKFRDAATQTEQYKGPPRRIMRYRKVRNSTGTYHIQKY